MTQQRPFPTTDVEERRVPSARRGTDDVRKRPMDRIACSEFRQPPTRLRCFSRVSRLFRAAVLRLKEIQEAGAVLVERVSLAALPACSLSSERFSASPNRAPENDRHYRGIFPC